MAHDGRYVVVGAESATVVPIARRDTGRSRPSTRSAHRLALDLDPEHPTPLYHQIAQAIRWKIGTGALSPGAPLPPLRDAEREWGVNYHTVRQAYAELKRQGYIESRRRLGTRVAGATRRTVREPDGNAALVRFLDTVRDQARSSYGLDVRQLVELLLPREAPLTRRSRVVVVECNAHQCSDVAAQLEASCQIEAVPWDLERRGPLPDLPIIGTYFHHNEMRSRWPERIPDMRFVALHLDPALAGRIRDRAKTCHATRLVVCERDHTTGRALAADLKRFIPARLEVTVTTRHPADVIGDARSDTLVAVAPRVWDTLKDATRANDCMIELRHVVSESDLARLRPGLRRAAGRHVTER